MKHNVIQNVNMSETIVFTNDSYARMSETVANNLADLLDKVDKTVVVVQGFQPRPTDILRPPSLTDIGRGLRLTLLGNVTEQDLIDLADLAKEAGFDYVVVPEDAAYVHVSVPNIDCGNSVADLLFVLDESGSVGYYNFQVMKDFTRTMASYFDIAPDKTRVAIVAYNGRARTVIDFDYIETHTKDDVLAEIDNIYYYAGSPDTCCVRLVCVCVSCVCVCLVCVLCVCVLCVCVCVVCVCVCFV